MKHLVIALLVTMGLQAGAAQAENGHEQWINLQSMSSPIFRSAQLAQPQIAKVGRTDRSTMAGKKAGQLIAKGRLMQQKIIASQGKPLPARQLNALQALILEMDQAAAKPGNGTQGACFKSCDDAYGSGFGGGKGWNRFWCKASCFKINVNVGPGLSKDPVGSLAGGATNTAQPTASLKASPASGSQRADHSQGRRSAP